ncbi:MAG TPA: hypothetical protein ENJ48_02870 [Anaerolineae bacterium]|nr:hypothetical protein [Anaerolineae bacterium]
MSIIFLLHSIWRWVILLVAIVAVGKAILGWVTNQRWQSVDNLLGMAYTTAFDIQLLLGLIVYGGAFAGLHTVRWYTGSVMRLSMEHVLVMVVALVLVHLGSRAIKRNTADSRKFRAAALWFGVSLLLMLAAIPTWSMSATA